MARSGPLRVCIEGLTLGVAAATAATEAAATVPSELQSSARIV